MLSGRGLSGSLYARCSGLRSGLPLHLGQVSPLVSRAFSSALPSTGKHAVPQNKKGTPPAAFEYAPLFAHGTNPVETPYRRLDDASEHVIVKDGVLHVAPEALTELSRVAMTDIAHLLRPGHLQQLRNIYDDPEASENDKFVALQLLKNANIASGFVLPGCQDTGTAIVMGKRGGGVITEGNDEEALSRGVYDTYTQTNLRYSQVAPIDMYTEKNTGNNLPAQVELFATPGNEYHFHFMAKGGGSANKTFLYQQTKKLLNPESMKQFLLDNIKTIGTAACPPYHLALVIGGLSAEQTLKL